MFEFHGTGSGFNPSFKSDHLFPADPPHETTGTLLLPERLAGWLQRAVQVAATETETSHRADANAEPSLKIRRRRPLHILPILPRAI